MKSSVAAAIATTATRRRHLAPRLVLALLVAFAVAGASCHRHPAGPVAPHSAVGAGASALRDAFNSAAGKTRVVALVSPT